MSYARCDWSVTVFISGYANTVVTSQHVSQSYFIKEIENGCPVFILPDANTPKVRIRGIANRESLLTFTNSLFSQTKNRYS